MGSERSRQRVCTREEQPNVPTRLLPHETARDGSLGLHATSA